MIDLNDCKLLSIMLTTIYIYCYNAYMNMRRKSTKPRCPSCNKASSRAIEMKLLDELTYERLYSCQSCNHEWSLKLPLRVRENKYTLTTIPLNKRLIFLHRWVWQASRNTELAPNQVIHHLNGIKGDNRPSNLFAIPERLHSGYLNGKSSSEIIAKLKKRIIELELQLEQKKLL